MLFCFCQCNLLTQLCHLQLRDKTQSATAAGAIDAVLHAEALQQAVKFRMCCVLFLGRLLSPTRVIAFFSILVMQIATLHKDKMKQKHRCPPGTKCLPGVLPSQYCGIWDMSCASVLAPVTRRHKLIFWHSAFCHKKQHAGHCCVQGMQRTCYLLLLALCTIGQCAFLLLQKDDLAALQVRSFCGVRFPVCDLGRQLPSVLCNPVTKPIDSDSEPTNTVLYCRAIKRYNCQMPCIRMQLLQA